VFINNHKEQNITCYNKITLHCKNEYALSHQKNCGNRLQAILLIKFKQISIE